MVLENIIALHAEDAAFLWLLRDRAIRAPHYRLRDLLKFDERLEAHLDGLRIAGAPGWERCEAQLQTEESGEMFAAGVLALSAGHVDRIERLLALAEAAPGTRPGLCSAFAWVPWPRVQATVGKLLDASSSFQRWAAFACHGAHRADPQRALSAALEDGDPLVRARALQLTGELGRQDLLLNCRNLLDDSDDACRFWACWSSVLLGERSLALDALRSFCLYANPFRECALQIVLRALHPAAALDLLAALERNPGDTRQVTQGAGIAGAPARIPLLIRLISEPKWARLAGESLALITGLDIAFENLKCQRPADFQSGPTDNPEDEDIDLDADENLPWPNGAAIQKWWDAHREQFHGGPYLCGAYPDTPHCFKILREGYQRQRAAAALHLSLLNSGLPYFDCGAPAWNQLRMLDEGVLRHQRC